jgi:four helix bundle protein
MQFGHEQLNVCRVSIRYLAWACETAKRLNGIDRHARDQPLRASQSIPLNIAEGNGKGANADRHRFFEVARGSALECGSIRDCPEVCGVPTAAENAQDKTVSISIVSMLTKLGQRNREVRENPGRYDHLDSDSDYDNGAEGSR